jgi:hypothetical protein
MPHPQTGPTELQDWRPLLDEALSRLPERLRAPVVLCDLQGLSRREAACKLCLAHGTLSHRLAAGRRLLAQQLSRRGVLLSGGALAALLSGGAASAQVPGALVLTTAKGASLVAAGHLAAVTTPVAVLTMGVLRAMWIAKVRVVGAAVLAVTALGTGVAYHSETVWAQQTAQATPAKPRSEVESLRRENELLRLNLEVVLEKVRAQEKELRELRGKTAATGLLFDTDALQALGANNVRARELKPRPAPDGLRQAEEALRALRDAKDEPSRRRALEALDRALRTLREQKADSSSNNKKS